jgi:hypothetical protein
MPSTVSLQRGEDILLSIIIIGLRRIRWPYRKIWPRIESIKHWQPLCTDTQGEMSSVSQHIIFIFACYCPNSATTTNFLPASYPLQRGYQQCQIIYKFLPCYNLQHLIFVERLWVSTGNWLSEVEVVNSECL